jgi:DNA-binding transcriptional ArsR family regulator
MAHFADRLSSCVLHIFVFACIRKFMKNDPSGQDAKRLFRALSAESRQQILRLVADRWLCVGALSNRLGMSAGAMSQHLRILRDAGLVDSNRQGTFIHYRATPDAADRCREAIETVFGESGGEGPECRGSEGECQ